MAAQHDAEQMGKTLFSELEKGPRANLEKCHELVEKGASLRYIGTGSNHALVLAILYNHDALAFGMMDKDPGIVNLPGSNGNVPALFAVYRNEQDIGVDRYMNMIERLEKSGANFLAENIVGTTPLKAAELRDAHRPTAISARALEKVSEIVARQEKAATQNPDKKLVAGVPIAPEVF
jgi:hypothetical protein